MAASHHDNRIRECPLCQWDGNPRNCRWCNRSLTGRQERWCTDHGADGTAIGWFENHVWTDVRRAALNRDGHRCTRCFTDPTEAAILARAACDAAGGYLYPPNPRSSTTIVNWRNGTPLQRQMSTWYRQRISDTQLEVNHITPILGRHKINGCHHHLDGTETLCRRCHLQTTALQRRLGLIP